MVVAVGINRQTMKSKKIVKVLIVLFLVAVVCLAYKETYHEDQFQEDVNKFIELGIERPQSMEFQIYALEISNKYQGNGGLKFMRGVYEELKKRKQRGEDIGPGFRVLLMNDDIESPGK